MEGLPNRYVTLPLCFEIGLVCYSYVLIDVRYSEFDLMQDANECWTEVVRCLQQEVDVPQELSKVN